MCDNQHLVNIIQKDIKDVLQKHLQTDDIKVSISKYTTHETSNAITHCNSDMDIEINGAKYKSQSVATFGKE
ncbi:MAG: septum formation topological specificity factor MinE [Candidatus Deianiraeaceae bacterium]|jgi:septum formation topological specificity factor MinE